MKKKTKRPFLSLEKKERVFMKFEPAPSFKEEWLEWLDMVLATNKKKGQIKTKTIYARSNNFRNKKVGQRI